MQHHPRHMGVTFNIWERMTLNTSHSYTYIQEVVLYLMVVKHTAMLHTATHTGIGLSKRGKSHCNTSHWYTHTGSGTLFNGCKAHCNTSHCYTLITGSGILFNGCEAHCSTSHCYTYIQEVGLYVIGVKHTATLHTATHIHQVALYLTGMKRTATIHTATPPYEVGLNLMMWITLQHFTLLHTHTGRGTLSNRG